MSVDPGDRPDPDPLRLRPPSDFLLAGRLVQPSLQRVTSEGRTLTLEPKLMRVLVLLASRPGQLVSKDELFRDVWEGAFVTEDVLTRAIGELRRTFDDDASNPRVIETIRKSGYRLIAPVREPDEIGEAGGIEDEKETGREPMRSRPAKPAAALAAVLATVAALAASVFGIRSLVRARPAAPAPMRVRPLTTFPGNERDPAVSPDGSRVAFAWNGGAGDACSLYVQLVDGDSPLRLTRASGAQDRAPAWSPDGQRIAFTRSAAASPGGAAGKDDCSIFTVSALGGSERRVAPCGDPDYRRMAWSPDGRWLALTVRDPKTSQREIELLSPETLERRSLTHPPAGILGDTSPAFSPDGRELAFSRNTTDSVGDVYRVPLGGGDPVRLTFDDRDTMGFEWSGDGGSIVFSSSRAGIYSLWRVPARGGEPTWVAGGGAKMKHPSTARTRNLVAFESWIYQVSLWRVPAGRSGNVPAGRSGNVPAGRSGDVPAGRSGNVPAGRSGDVPAGRSEGVPAADRPGTIPGSRLTMATDEWDFEPSFSPDGARVAFVSTRSGSDEIWIVPSEGGEPIRRTSYGGARLELPRWSPDGRRLLISVRRGARAEIHAVDASGGVPERLFTGDTDAVAPAWSSDGRAVYFGSRRPGVGPWRVWRLELASRRLEPATPAGGYAAQEAPDGSALYFTRADAAGIWRAAPGGASAERVLDMVPPEDWADWQPARGGAYVRVRDRNGDLSLAFAPFGGTLQRLTPLTDQGWAGFAVSPDGKWLLYPKVERHTCDIKLIENPG